jgi:hypothetical protein
VRELFAEYKTIHRKKRTDGQWGYNRDGDDMVAAHENTVAVIRSREFHIPERMALRRPKPSRSYLPTGQAGGQAGTATGTPRRGL